jgi:hypothetical protein
MLLNKNQLEAVRYQAKKLGTTVTNDEIRNSADKFKDFDALLIANDVVSCRTSELSTIPQNHELEPATESSNDDSMLSLLNNPIPQSNTLTTTQKHALIQIKSQELGIDLTVTEITKISDMVSEQINDSINFLSEVGILISEFFTNRNNQVQDIVNQKIEDITQIINTGNEQLGDIFNGANRRLMDIANESSQVKTDYKSGYQSKLESIREILKLSA